MDIKLNTSQQFALVEEEANSISGWRSKSGQGKWPLSVPIWSAVSCWDSWAQETWTHWGESREAIKMVGGAGAPDVWGEAESARNVHPGNRKLKGGPVAVTNNLMVDPSWRRTATAQEATETSGNKGNAKQIVEGGKKEKNFQKHWKRCTEKFWNLHPWSYAKLNWTWPSSTSITCVWFQGGWIRWPPKVWSKLFYYSAFGQKFANLNMHSNKYIQVLALGYLDTSNTSEYQDTNYSVLWSNGPKSINTLILRACILID